MPCRTSVRRSALANGVLLTFAAKIAWAQDPVEVDSKHYRVEFENERVRVLRVTYGPHEQSVMHEHPDGVAVFLTDHDVKFTLPDGTSQESHVKAGQTQWTPAGKHLPENLGDKSLELILVELKSSASAAQ